MPLGSFFGVTYDEVSVPLTAGDVFVFCSDGVSEAMNERGEEFTSGRLIEVVKASRQGSAREIVQAHRPGGGSPSGRLPAERRHDGRGAEDAGLGERFRSSEPVSSEFQVLGSKFPTAPKGQSEEPPGIDLERSGCGDASACLTLLTHPDDAERLIPLVSRPVPFWSAQNPAQNARAVVDG